eukprot:TRINITY_DN38765_c0_g1_i1.p1 TRINITY_DN38765_c0_g1~~TRINITY_DN38765_c0_g1_i1.p1  ORF type:complete len:936 (-),score=124.19 TRINITY_DN38765_c0_g1_i1:136-2943(-)
MVHLPVMIGALSTSLAAGAGLVDDAIRGSSILYLDGDQWYAALFDDGVDRPRFTIPATVPGDHITDLERVGLIGDPLYELNFRNGTLWGEDGTSWQYSRVFEFHSQSADEDHLLVFDGVKMGASIALNGEPLGIVTDQFLRYNFTVQPTQGKNVLTVTFDDTSTGGRFMACSGGWDWGPYSTTYADGDHTFTKGIWKSVYIVSFPKAAAAITHLVPHTFYLGDHPVEPLVDGHHAGFRVQLGVHLRAGLAGASGEVTASGSWSPGVVSKLQVDLKPGEERLVVLKLLASASQINLWWPVGYGDHPLYEVQASFLGVNASRHLGFRVAALVTGNDTDAAYREGAKAAEGSDDHGLFFRVNGAAVAVRGSNVIPMDNMEGRYSASAHRQMVHSALGGNMNFLRVWGGGVFLPDAFYDTADEVGMLVYHDMMYTTTSKTHEPTASHAEALEIAHNVRRLSAHPSIIVWNSCNECSAKDLYVSFVMTTVAAEDQSRPIWPGCPSRGWGSGVRKLDSLPTGSPLSPKVSGKVIERHGAYFNGNGWQAVNQAPANKLLIRETNLPVPLAQEFTGLGLPSVFTSEFGASVFSSFESMSPTLAQEHWGVHGGAPEDDCTEGDTTTSFWKICKHGNVMAQRNYPCDNLILGYFGRDKSEQLEATGKSAFKRQLWQCMIAQALALKSDIEARRAQNTFGIVTWQLNEIWPTGGWGSLEYGTVGFTAGQVLGGRWRPLHHFMRESLYADTMATCGVEGVCYIRHDGINPFRGVVEIAASRISGSNAGERNVLVKKNVSLLAGPGETLWFNAVNWSDYLDGSWVFTSAVCCADGVAVSEHVILPVAPSGLQLDPADITVEVGDLSAQGSVPVVLTSSAPALFVTLTSAAQGRFSKNAFFIPRANHEVKVDFLPFPEAGPFELGVLKQSLRVEDLSLNMASGSAAVFI